MANKYSKYRLQPYVSMYTDPGSDEVATTLRERWDANKKEYDLLQRTAALTEVGPGGQKYKDQAIQDINNTFEKTIKMGNFENAGMVVSKAVNDFAANEGVNSARENMKIRKEYEAEVRKRQMDGELILFDKEIARDENGNVVYEIGPDGVERPKMIDKWDTFDPMQMVDGKLVRNTYRPEGEKQLGWDTKKQELIKDIRNDPVFLDRYDIKDDELIGYLMDGKEIDEVKANAIAAKMQQVYLTTVEGKQEMRALMEQSINPETRNTFTEEEARQHILESMQGLAAKQIGKDLTYRHDVFMMEQLKQANKANSNGNGSYSIQNLNTTIDKVKNNESKNSMLSILPTLKDGDGFIIGIDYEKLSKSDSDIFSIDEHWQNNIEFNHTDPKINELVPYLYDEDDYTLNSDGTYTVDDDAQVLTREEVESLVNVESELWNEGYQWVSGHMGAGNWGMRDGAEAAEAREKIKALKASLDSHATKYNGDKGKDHQKMFIEVDGERRYNFLRDGKYRQIIEEQNGEGGLLEKKNGRYVGYDYDDPDNPQTEAEWLAEKTLEVEEMAKLSLRQDYEDLIEEKGGTMSQDELNQLIKKGYMDEYMAYMLHKHQDARHAVDANGTPLFKDDFDFLEAQSMALAHYENSASTIYHGDAPWREAAAKQLREGMLKDLIGSSGVTVEGHDGTIKSIDELAEVLAKKYKKLAQGKGPLGIFGGKEKTMKKFILAALLNSDDTSGLRVNGVIPLEGGAFDCLLDMDAKSMGLQGEEAEQWNKWIKSKTFRQVMEFQVGGSEEMKDIFKDSTQIMDAMRNGRQGDYTGKQGDYLPLGNNAGFVTQAYFVFNPKSRLYEPVIEFIDPTNGEVVMEANGLAQYDQMIKAQMNTLMNRPSSLNRLAGSDTKGKVE